MRAVWGGDLSIKGRPDLSVSFLRNVVRACPPACDLLVGNSPEGQVAVVAGPAPGEVPVHVGRLARHRAEGDLILARHPSTQGHLVLVAPPDDQLVDDRGGPSLGGQEGVRVEHLEEARGGELFVEGQQVVQVRGPAPVVPEDEQRGLHHGLLDPMEVGPSFDPGGDRIGGAEGGLDQGTGPVFRVDGEAVTPEQGRPVAEGHPFERVEDVPGDEVLETFGHSLSPSTTLRSPSAGTGEGSIVVGSWRRRCANNSPRFKDLRQ